MDFAYKSELVNFATQNVLFIGSLILIISILIGKAGYKYGLPSLLLFLGVGMFIGVDGIGLPFENHANAQFIGTMALSIILFSGGMDTKISDIRPVAKQGILLATLGVLLTAIFTGLFIWGVARIFHSSLTFAESMLLAAVMSSTDSASVFSLLRSKGLALKENLRPLLELESGSNDPMAFMIATALIGYINEGSGISVETFIDFFIQIGVGVVFGIAFARIIIWSVNRINLDNQSLYSVFLVAWTFFLFSATDYLGGNGYLAVYLAGLIVGNSRMIHRKNIARFFDDFAWLWQIVMFLMLGMLVTPSELLPIAAMGISVGLFMILLGRPLSVIICLAPFKKFSRSAIKYTSWVGLRGAVPIIFATYLLTENIPHSRDMFNIVFFITILSLIVQGMTVISSARFFGVEDDTPPDATYFGVELPDEIKSAMAEIEVNADILSNGDTLSQFNLPPNTLVMMVRRGTSFFIPRGDTKLQESDKLLVISDKDEDLKTTFAQMGVRAYKFDKNF